MEKRRKGRRTRTAAAARQSRKVRAEDGIQEYKDTSLYRSMCFIL